MVLGLRQGNLLIDTPPDLRFQLLREKIGIVHAVVYTHEHSDHVMGLDDLRLMQFYLAPLFRCIANRKSKIGFASVLTMPLRPTNRLIPGQHRN